MKYFIIVLMWVMASTVSVLVLPDEWAATRIIQVALALVAIPPLVAFNWIVFKFLFNQFLNAVRCLKS